MEKNISHNDMHNFAICRLIIILILSNNDKLFIKIIHPKTRAPSKYFNVHFTLLPHYLQQLLQQSVMGCDSISKLFEKGVWIRMCHKMKHTAVMACFKKFFVQILLISVIHCCNAPSCLLHTQLCRIYLDKYKNSCDVIPLAYLYGDDSPQTLVFQDYYCDRTQA